MVTSGPWQDLHLAGRGWDVNERNLLRKHPFRRGFVDEKGGSQPAESAPPAAAHARESAPRSTPAASQAWHPRPAAETWPRSAATPPPGSATRRPSSRCAQGTRVRRRRLGCVGPRHERGGGEGSKRGVEGGARFLWDGLVTPRSAMEYHRKGPACTPHGGGLVAPAVVATTCTAKPYRRFSLVPCRPAPPSPPSSVCPTDARREKRGAEADLLLPPEPCDGEGEEAWVCCCASATTA